MKGYSTPDRIRNQFRIWRMNRSSGIQVARSAYLARGVRLQTTADDVAYGGCITVSDHVTLSDGVIVATYGGTVELQAHVYIGPYSVIYGHGGLVIGRNTMIAAHTVIIPATHGFQQFNTPMRKQPLTTRGIDIGADVWIGSGCKILDGVKIGSGAVIGAGSVVTKDIASRSIAVGVPAEVVRSREDAG